MTTMEKMKMMPDGHPAQESAETLESRTVTVDGVKLRYHVAGTGPVCVMHPGGPGVEWPYLRMPVVERHVTAVYLEPAGTGGSGQLPDHPHGYTVERYTELLYGVVEALGGGRPYLLGHSHGGFVAQQFAITHPGSVGGLILYDSAPVATGEFHDEADRGIRRHARRHRDRDEMSDALRAWESPEPETDEELTGYLRRLLPAYFADYWRMGPAVARMRAALRVRYVSEDGEDFDVRSRLGSIATPTLVISGRYDFICGTRWARQLHAGIPGARLALLESSGHFGHIEEPEGFARAVADFVGTGCEHPGTSE